MIFRRYRAFYLSCLCAFTAGHMLNYSIIIYAQEVIRSDLLSGIGFGLCFGPPVVVGWYAGVLCDRVAPGRLIHWAQASFAAAALFLLAADRSLSEPSDRVALVMVAATLAGIGWSFASPARMAALGQIVRAEELKKASVAFNLLVMLGFGLAPVMIAASGRPFGWPGVFMAAAGLLALASALLLPVKTRRSERAARPVLQEIGEGIHAVASRPLLRQLMLAATVGYLAMGPLQVLLPKLARTQLDLSDVQRGWFLGTLALSLIGGGLLALAGAGRLHQGHAILAATVLAGVLLASLGAAHDPRWATVVLAGVGLAGGLALSLIVAGIQANAPEALRGRIVSMYTIVSQVVPAASGVAAGALVQGFGVAAALGVCGGFLAVITAGNGISMRVLRGHRG